MPAFHLSVAFSIVLLLLAAAGSAALAFFVYRFTVPVISRSRKLVLVALRSAGIFAVVFLIGEPLLTLITRSVEPPVVAVLIDQSLSMAIGEKTGNRAEKLRSVLRAPVWQELGKAGPVSYAAFAGSVHRYDRFTVDSLRLEGEETDIGGAFRSVRRMFESANLQAIALVSDGNPTVGVNPVYEAQETGVPVFTVGIGDTSEQKDVLIRKVLTNDISYVGTKVPVNVTVHSAGCGGERVSVTLREGPVVRDQKTLVLEEGSRDYSLPLSFTPDTEGIAKLTVDVSAVPGELTSRNNRMTAFSKVLKNRFRIVLVSGQPNPDEAFIRRTLENNPNFETRAFVEQADGGFYAGPLTPQAVNEADCILLDGYPTPGSREEAIRTIRDAANNGKPLFLVLGRTMDGQKLHILDPVLPFEFGTIGGEEQQVFVALPDAALNNPIVRTREGSNPSDVWAKLPPVYRTPAEFRTKPGTEVLATVRVQSVTFHDPFIVDRNVRGVKSIAVLGYGIWRWKMLSESGSGSGEIPGDLLRNGIRWLTTREDERRIRVQAAKQTYSTQEPVDFTAQVYDENYEPVDDAQIDLRAVRGSGTYPLSLHPLGSGQFQGAFDRLPEGEYSFTATVLENGRSIGSGRGSFSVGGVSAEYLETRMNKSLLEQVAAQTGGRYYDPRAVHSLAGDISALPNFKPRETHKSAEIDIWNSRWMLALVTLVFSAEWFLRKQSGML